MPKTTIYIKTWRCNACPAVIDYEPENGLCIEAGCSGSMILVTDQKLKSKLIIIGDEDIEDEINPEKETKLVRKMAIKTDAHKEAYRVARRKDIAEAIAAARLKEDK